jgi:molybdopterin-guanine dinucleotide biosynthesis protein A
MRAIHCGILVGGLGTRMGGVAKGLLRTGPDGPRLVERLRVELLQACPGAQVVLVGQRPEYAEFGSPLLADAIQGVGPLGGLKALLDDAERCGAADVLALACDLPFVTAALVRRLAQEAPDALALAPKQDGRWQPLCARYAVREGLNAVNELLSRCDFRTFRLLDALAAHQLQLSDQEHGELVDWDRPEDVGG